MKTILLIEDNIDILENLSEYLDLEGYDTLKADNGMTGIELAHEFMPNLIICDVMMYGTDGHEVLRLLKAFPKTNRIPFIFSTSLSENIDREQTLKLGADDYIVKPYELDILLAMVKKWIK